ncbi:helix-turn-helix domain-containing protein [Alteromonadaceae bacterium BrNp21-10]|nr:helix-turn-helix domain-containing protein [Alteromonadaceae bacterium BrNp21-10]
MAEKLKPAKGLIQQHVSLQHFELNHYLPATDLADFIEHYWVVSWDLVDKPAHTQQNLPHPSQHIVIDPQGQTGITGIKSGAFSYTLKGQGQVFGVKFWPGAFHCIYGRSVDELHNQCIPVNPLLKAENHQLQQALIKADNISHMIDYMQQLLRHTNPQLDEKAKLSRQIVAYIEANKMMLTVTELCEKFSIEQRSLQRLFKSYIGVSPKWVIDRYRIMDALTNLNNGSNINMTELAHDLGYFDQAHFNHTFKALTGLSPGKAK